MAEKRSTAARIEAYVKRRNAAFLPLTRQLRSVVKKVAPMVEEDLNPWGIPSFELNGPLAYFMVGKYHVTFGFARGASLDDPNELLEGTGKNLRHVKLRTREDLADPGLRSLLQDALKLNVENPDAKRKKKGSKANNRQNL